MKYRFLLILPLLVLTISSTQAQKKFDLDASVARGKDIYLVQCLSCHQEDGKGIEQVYPPLAGSDYLMADKQRSVRQILFGMAGEIKVNGITYAGEMNAFDLTDEEVSDVLNYIRNSWGNKGEAVRPENVKSERK